MEKKYLCFGTVKACQIWAHERNQPFSTCKIVKKPSDYLGYRGVELVYCGSYESRDYDLYREAQEYFSNK